MNNADLSRREFLQRTAALGAVVGAGSFIAACSGQTPTVEGGVQSQMVGLDCTDVSGLDESQKNTRIVLQYMDKSAVEGQSCANCMKYVEPTSANTCGTCRVVAGPINPEGHCAAWAARAD